MTPPDTRSAARLDSRRRARRAKKYVSLVAGAVLVIGAAIAVAVAQEGSTTPDPSTPLTYLGVYEPDSPSSYAGVDQFAQNIGRQPNLVSYYSPWGYPFQVGFATSAAENGAMTLVQMDPMHVSLASIAAGRYDVYLRTYATSVKAFSEKVVVSFGHEMNGRWYSWGYQHTPPAVFVAAWRHIVDLFRSVGAKNVTWLWTVNIIDKSPPIPAPNNWWPGKKYVNWVGIDGYYYQPSDVFAQVFGPTIVDVRALTGDPILIAETSAEPSTGQPAKIKDLFAGVRTYGLLGFIWFDANSQGRVWRISNPGAFAAFRMDARTFMGTRAPVLQPSSSGHPSS
jgi:glycosyl hydrolase family 26